MWNSMKERIVQMSSMLSESLAASSFATASNSDWRDRRTVSKNGVIAERGMVRRTAVCLTAIIRRTRSITCCSVSSSISSKMLGWWMGIF